MGSNRYGFALEVILIIGGIGWCAAIFNRRHDDLRKLRETNVPLDRYVIWGFWTVTAVVFLFVVWRGIAALVAMYRLFTGW